MKVSVIIPMAIFVASFICTTLLLSNCRAIKDQRIYFPKCTAGQTAEFVVYEPANQDGSRNSALFKTFHCTAGKWESEHEFSYGIKKQ